MHAALARWRHRLRVWRRLTPLGKWLLAPSWCLLGLAAAATHLVHFERLAARLGRPAGLLPPTPPTTERQRARAAAIGECIELAARHTPWPSLCQAQAIAARVWLGLLGLPYVIRYGVKKAPSGALEAHAWINCGPVVVTGGEHCDDYTVVATFAGRANQPPAST